MTTCRRKRILGGLAAVPLALMATLHAAPPELETQGNQIVVKATGEPVRLTGVNIPSLQWGPGDRILTSLQVAVNDWKCNVIRLPVKGSSWLNNSTYRDTVDNFISQASNMGVYVVLDLHRDGYVQPADVTFWQSAGAYFANDPAVLYGLFNEPTGINWDQWYYGKDSNPGMQDLVNTVRAEGADNVLLASGLDWGYALNGIVTQGYALTDSASGNGIVYESHVYPWKGYTSTQVIACAQEYPVLLGEFGHPGGTTFNPPIPGSFEHHSTWVPTFLDWVDTHRLHWTGWCLYNGSDPAMLADDDYTPTSYWGQPAKDRLNAYVDPNAVRPIGGTTIGTTGSYSDPNSGVVTDAGEGAMACFGAKPYNSYFNAPTASGAWTGKDLITPKELTGFTFMPRENYGHRMVGGKFQVSSTADFSSDVHTLHTIASEPVDDGATLTTVDVTGSPAKRYVRYLGPDGAYCNIGFLKFHGKDPDADARLPTNIYIDDNEPTGVTFHGNWTPSAFRDGHFGDTYHHDGGDDDLTKWVRFTPEIHVAGTYTVSLHWPAHENHDSNVPVEITHANGVSSFTVDQTATGGQWVELDTLEFDTGTGGYLTLFNYGVSGTVIADAVRFELQSASEEDTDPDAYWDFDDGSGSIAMDLSDNALDIALQGTYAWTAGQIGGALDLGGQANSYGTLADPDELENTEKLSIAFWVRPENLDGSARFVVSKRDAADVNAAYSVFFATGNRLYVDLNKNNNSNRHITTTQFQNDTWYHVAVVYDGSLPSGERGRVYINGQLEVNSPFAVSGATIPDYPSDLYLGIANSGYATTFGGKIDDLEIHRDALSAAEVSERYGITPEAYWDFDDGSGSTAMDLSDNALDIALQGTYAWTTGQNGGALDLSGQANSYGTLADPDQLENTGKLSIVFWVRPENLDGSARFVVSKRDAADVNSAYSLFFATGNRLYVDFNKNNNSNRHITTTQFQNDTWYHVAAVYDGSLPQNERGRVYINGDLDANSPFSVGGSTIPNYPSDLYLGIANSGYPTTFGGVIDNLEFYRAALTEPEVEELGGF